MVIEKTALEMPHLSSPLVVIENRPKNQNKTGSLPISKKKRKDTVRGHVTRINYFK